MFEKVCAGRRERRRTLQVGGVWASLGGHALFFTGIAAALSGAPRTPVSAETATMLLLYRPLPATATAPLPLLPRVRPANAAAVRIRAALRSDDGGEALRPRAAAPAGETGPLPAADELRFRMPQSVAIAGAATESALDLKLHVGRGAVGGVPDSGAIRPGSYGSGEAPVVDAEALAETPRILNEREISAVLSRLYPYRFRGRETEGEVVMMFIIGIDGRPEMGSVQVISTTSAEFVEPTLRGLRRMRFRPARLDGVPVRVRAMLPVAWVLRKN
jgi:hypothetical protein